MVSISYLIPLSTSSDNNIFNGTIRIKGCEVIAGPVGGSRREQELEDGKTQDASWKESGNWLTMLDDAEFLLVASETSDPYATLLISPKLGVSHWSYKGNELQGSVIGSVELFRNNYLIVAAKDKPLLHVVSMDNSKHLHVKSVLPRPVRHLVVTPDGGILFAAVNNQIYIWIVSTGELVTVVNAHYRTISGLVLSSDGSLLVTGAEDGSVCVFVIAELISGDPSLERAVPFREWRAHSLAISCDVALSSCAIDPAESRLFLGTADGALAQLDLYSLNKTEISVVIEAEGTGNLLLFSHHSAELVRLDINHDGTLLASGDVCGVYVIWDILSRQCLKTSSLKGPICKLRFNMPLEVLRKNEKKKRMLPVASLKRQKRGNLPTLVLLKDGMLSEKAPSFVVQFESN
uniref:Anaphase-promoting complex subunit 4 WD40 domain-containing protein n=1 Tax=Setaria digitata TaxID=48799 RepID=A0A915Q5D2_9BILA